MNHSFVYERKKILLYITLLLDLLIKIVSNALMKIILYTQNSVFLLPIGFMLLIMVKRKKILQKKVRTICR